MLKDDGIFALCLTPSLVSLFLSSFLSLPVSLTAHRFQSDAENLLF